MKFRKNLLVLAGAAAMTLSACGGIDPAKSLTVCLASEPDTIDPALNSAVDGATLLVHLDSGLYRFTQTANGGLSLVYDLAEKIEKSTVKVVDHEQQEDKTWKAVEYNEGTRYTVTLRDGLKWNDGAALTADDFIYSWNRAASSTLGADYGYMFDPIADAVYHENDDAACPSMGINKVSDLVFTIDLMVDVPYFDQLLAFPTYFPVQKATIDANDAEEPGTWATNPDTYKSCGAYYLASWEHNSNIVLKKNPNYWNAENITMEQITFALSDDSSAMLASFLNNEYELIDDVPTEQMAELAKNYPNEYKVAGQMGTYYISFNMNAKFGDDSITDTEAKKVKVRKALGLLIDREYIVVNIGQAGQIPANAFVSAGLSDAAGGEFVDHNGPDRDGKGYYNKGATDAEYKANVAEAIALLKEVGFTYNDETKKFTNFPKFEYLYNTSEVHKKIGQNIKDTFAIYGIDMDLKNQEWNTFLSTRKEGNFQVARNGWVADYDDPSSYLTMWTTKSGNNDSQFGKGAHADLAIYSADVNRDGVKEDNLTWAQSYDVLVNLSNKETDAVKRFALLHESEDLLMETGAICPIYYYTDIYMIKSNIKGFFSSPLGYKFFMYATKA